MYIRMSAFDASHGWESVKLSFIVNRPANEPGFHLERQEVNGRNIRYTTRSYATEQAGRQPLLIGAGRCYDRPMSKLYPKVKAMGLFVSNGRFLASSHLDNVQGRGVSPAAGRAY